MSYLNGIKSDDLIIRFIKQNYHKYVQTIRNSG